MQIAQGFTALILAAISGHTAIVTALIGAGPQWTCTPKTAPLH